MTLDVDRPDAAGPARWGTGPVGDRQHNCSRRAAGGTTGSSATLKRVQNGARRRGKVAVGTVVHAVGILPDHPSPRCTGDRVVQAPPTGFEPGLAP